MKLLALSPVFTVIIGLLTDRCLGQNTVPVDPKDVELQVQQLGGAILPYQAVRIRAAVRNVSQKKLGPMSRIDLLMTEISGPNDRQYKEVGNAFLYERFERRDISVPTACADFNWRVGLFLFPEETHSVSVARGADWSGAKARILFPEPGTYSIKCGYYVDSKNNKRIFKTIEVKVLEPDGMERDVYELLKKDPQLAGELLKPSLDCPGVEVYRKVKKLIEDYPTSSYVQYARLTLARSLPTALRDQTTPRVCSAMVADELDKVIKHRYDPDKKQMFPDDFPFRPFALAMKANRMDFDRTNALLSLHREHRDSLQWIHEFARLLHSGSGGSTMTRRFHADLQDVLSLDTRRLPPLEDIWAEFRKVPKPENRPGT